jgi:hypothetical protein
MGLIPLKEVWKMRKILVGVAAVGVLAFCVAASAAPRGDDGYTLPEVLQGRARVVNIETPTLINPGKASAQAETPIHPSNIVVQVINDEAVARGVTATGPGAEAVVFSQMLDSGYGWFMDNTPGTVEWSQMIFGNGWVPGADLSSFTARVFVSSANYGAFGGTGGLTMELWDGDPYEIFDTGCSGVGSVPIAGTTCTFTDLPEATVYDLTCVFETKVPINCDRVTGVIWPDDICRWAWRMSSGMNPGGAINAPQVGGGDASGCIWHCGQLYSSALVGNCATPSGFNVGFCCDDVSGEPGEVACDHTDADWDNWTPNGGCNPGGGMHITMCSSGSVDYYAGYANEAPLYYNNFVGEAYARTDTIMRVQPMSVDAIPPAASPSFVTIDGSTVTIDQAYPGAERHLWFEIYVSDWDPGLTGLTLKAWQAALDASGYSAGLACSLQPWQPACTTDADCIAAQGVVGTGMDVMKGGCNLAGIPAGHCAAAFTPGRPDFIFYMLALTGGIDQSTLNYRYGATLSGGPMVSPHIGDMYLGSLTLKTSCDCPAGDFSVGLMLPNDSVLVQGDNQFVPLLGVVGADVIFPVGQCCNITENPSVCISDTVTRCECEALGIDGGFATNFDMEKTCADPCIECLGPDDTGPCADGDACTVDTCEELFCVHTPVVVPAGNCCDYTTGNDILGGGTITPLGSDQCTFDYCSDPGACAAGAACGVPTFDVLEGDPCYDGEPCITVNDTCMADASCVGTDILTVPCTDNATCEDLTAGLGSCNFVTGYCRCVPPSLNFDIHPSQKPNDACFLVGEPVTVDVYFKDVPQFVTGGQFVVDYDPACLDFVSIVPGGDPFVFEISEMVDEGAGTIFYAVGVDPFSGAGVQTEDVLATITFTKIGVCETCNMCFGGANPLNTYMVDSEGWMVPDVELMCSDDVMENDYLGLIVPDDVVMNVNSCDSDTAFVTWAAPTATSSCYDVDLICVGPWAMGDPHYVDPMTGGGEVPVGTWNFSCTATSTVCGDSVTDGWTVTVNDEVSLDVTLQVSPVIAVDELVRCIKFEMFADCVQDPYVFEKDVILGGLWDHTGHFTEAIKVPADGNWICITARDQLHTLRGCDYLTCEDGVYTATFKGDPFFGGNWLIGGNLDGFKKENPTASHDVIDILDFGQFVAQFGAQYGTGDTPCGTQGPNADINGDGVVSVLDFTFVTMNFLASSKECCCGGAVAGAPTLEISVEELRANGLGDLSVGDLNRDGVLNATDMTDFMNGVRPSKKSSHDRAGSSLR